MFSPGCSRHRTWNSGPQRATAGRSGSRRARSSCLTQPARSMPLSTGNRAPTAYEQGYAARRGPDMTIRNVQPPDDRAAVPADLSLFARIEGLVGEERALLEIPARERSQPQKDRLRDIGDELDRIWETLRARAERRAAH